MRYLIEILPQEELRSCVISYCRHRDRRLPIDKSNHRRSMISDSILKWLLKELENIHESKYHRHYAPVGLQLAYKEMLKNLAKEQENE